MALNYGGLRQRMIDSGILDPGRLPPEAKIPEGLRWIWRAWVRLHHDRPMTGGFGGVMPGRIPWAQIRDWCRFHALPSAAVGEMDACFAAMDGVYLDWHAAEAKRRTERR